jgi:hypothetical protein
MTAVGDQDVRGLEIAMHDLLRVHHVEGLADLAEEAARRRARSGRRS